MSEDKIKFDPDKVITDAVRNMHSFGYLDRTWVVSAFIKECVDTYKPAETNKTKRLTFLGIVFWPLIALGKLMAKPFRGKEIDRSAWPDEKKKLEKLDAAGRLEIGKTVGGLRRVLATIPVPPSSLYKQTGSAKSPRLESLAGVLDKLDPAPKKKIAKFLRKAGLEETGFPVRLIGEDGEPNLPALKDAESASDKTTEGKPELTPSPTNRDAALSLLTGGLLYRFAYDQEKKLEWGDTGKVFRASGVYRMYIVPPDATYVERRLMIVSLQEDGAIVRAAELRSRRGKFEVRGGYVIPAAGINTFVLSSDFSPQKLADMVLEALSIEARDIVFNGKSMEKVETTASFLQEHQLGFYSLFSRGEGEMRGSLLEAPTPASVVGYKVDPRDIDLRPPGKAQPASPGDDAMTGIPVDPGQSEQRTKKAELDFLTFEEIEERRDQILVAAVSKNPAVSIDIG